MATRLTRDPRRTARAWLAALAVSGGIAGAVAQGVPADEREPNPAAVGAAERAAGDAPNSAERRREAQTTDQIYRELTGQNPNAPDRATLPPAYGTPGQDARTEDQLYRELTGQNPNAPPPRQ